MKTRIISAVVGIAIFAVVLGFSIKYHPVLLVALAIINAIANYEMLHNTRFQKSPSLLILSLIYSLVAPFVIAFCAPMVMYYTFAVYVLLVAVITVWNHAKVDALSLFSAIAVPFILSFAFTTVYLLFSVESAAHIYFVLIFMFAWGADTAAYFGGTYFGKHKLAPEVSPKKTVEGSAFGILGSLILSLIVTVIYKLCGVSVNYWVVIASAIVFAVIGMVGDLFTSQIKRGCGIKDYGNIMPGHGGVLDRFDSVLLISPLFYLFLNVSKLI